MPYRLNGEFMMSTSNLGSLKSILVSNQPIRTIVIISISFRSFGWINEIQNIVLILAPPTLVLCQEFEHYYITSFRVFFFFLGLKCFCKGHAKDFTILKEQENLMEVLYSTSMLGSLCRFMASQ